MSTGKLAFTPEAVEVELENLIPTKLPHGVEKTVKRYGAILSSIKEVGVIEPLAIYPFKGAKGKFLILDGNLRYHALKQTAAKTAMCIVADVDECFTYNAKISRMSPIQEHRMIAKAVENGVTVERIASALNLSTTYIQESLNLLRGLHPDAVEILEPKHVSHQAIRAFRKVLPLRQVEMAELMLSANDFSASYARALLAATSEEFLVEKPDRSKSTSITEEEEAFLREEMRTLEKDFKGIEESYGDNILKLTTARAYLKSLLGNARVAKWLGQRHPEIAGEFEAIVASETL